MKYYATVMLPTLEETITPGIVDAIKIDASYDHYIFHQDGIPLHFYDPVIEYLEEELLGFWIWRRRHTEWQPKCPDLAPIDFLLLDYVKKRVFLIKPKNFH